MTIDDILNWWPILGGSVTFIVWLVRLEMKVLQNQKNLQDFEIRSEKRRAEDLANSQRAWDKLEAKLDNVQTDIKLLLQRRTE